MTGFPSTLVLAVRVVVLLGFREVVGLKKNSILDSPSCMSARIGIAINQFRHQKCNPRNSSDYPLYPSTPLCLSVLLSCRPINRPVVALCSHLYLCTLPVATICLRRCQDVPGPPPPPSSLLLSLPTRLQTPMRSIEACDRRRAELINLVSGLNKICNVFTLRQKASIDKPAEGSRGRGTRQRDEENSKQKLEAKPFCGLTTHTHTERNSSKYFRYLPHREVGKKLENMC